MKRFLLTLFKFAAFLVTFAAGSFFPPMKLKQTLSVTPDGTHVFQWDGVLLIAALLVLLLLIDAARKRIRTAGPWTVAAFVLALLLGLAAKLGFMTI